MYKSTSNMIFNIYIIVYLENKDICECDLTLIHKYKITIEMI